jgi:hypothetical protein
MTEVKYDKSHHAGATPEARIANRLRNSGQANEADYVVQKGSGPTRAFTNIHHKGNVMQRGEDNRGEGDINNRPRGVNNPKGQIP